MCALICLCVPSVRWSCDQEKYKEVYQARLAYHQQEFTKLLDAPGDFDIADHPMMHAFCTEVVDGELEVFGPDDVRSTVALNIAAQQVEMIATKWQLAEAGFECAHAAMWYVLVECWLSGMCWLRPGSGSGSALCSLGWCVRPSL